MEITQDMVGKEIIIWRWVDNYFQKTYANPVASFTDTHLNIFDSGINKESD